MTVVIYFVIMLLNLYLFITKRKVKVVDVATFAFFAVTFLGNIRSGESDIGRYRLHYLNRTSAIDSTFWHVEKGYGRLADYCSGLGIPFPLFLLVIFLVCSFLIFSLLDEFHCNYSVFFFLYGCFYYFFTLEVLRFYIALAILLFGIKLLLDNRLIQFLICILVATLFHKSFIVYLIFLIVPYRKITNKFYIAFMALMLLIVCVVFINGNRIPFYGDIYAMIFGGWKSNLYVDQKTHLGWIPYVLYYVFTVILVLFANRIISLAEVENQKEYKRLRDYETLCIRCLALVSFSLPLTMLRVEYFRIFFAVSLMSFILLAAVFGECITDENIKVTEDVPTQYFKPKGLHWNNLYVVEITFGVIAVMLVWSFIWWKLSLNNISLIGALKENIFFQPF